MDTRLTEQGVAMLSAVLQSPRAVAVSIDRVFVRLRKLLASHDGLARKLTELETRMTDHDEKFAMVFDAIRQLIEDDRAARRKPAIGYHTEVGPRARETGTQVVWRPALNSQHSGLSPRPRVSTSPRLPIPASPRPPGAGAVDPVG